MGRKIIPDYGDVKNPEIRARYGYLEATISIIGNIGLFILKFILGLFINSIALIADSIHSLSDVSTSGVVIIGFRMAKKQPDKEHPFGHGRAEYIATLIIAIVLIIIGFGFIERSIERIITPEPLAHSEFALLIGIIIILSAIFKEIMARYSYAIAKKIQSDVVKADAWHHRTDAISSIGVAIGIFGSRFGYPFLDPLFGFFVSGIIIYVGINLMRTTSNLLMGSAPDQKINQTIQDIAMGIKSIKGIHNISIHDYGTTKVVTLHAEVDNHLPIDQAHALADELENKIMEQTKYSTFIHLEPLTNQIDKKKDKTIIETILKNQKEIITFHKIQIIQSTQKDTIKVHIVVDEKMPVNDSHELCHRLEKLLQKQYGPCHVDIHIDPCNNNCSICTISCQKRKKSKK